MDDFIPTSHQNTVFHTVRFKEERKRLGFESRKEFAEATGFSLQKVAAFENKGSTIKAAYDYQVLLDLGFDIRYWQTGQRSNFFIHNSLEVDVLKVFRRLSSAQQMAALSKLLIEAGEGDDTEEFEG